MDINLTWTQPHLVGAGSERRPSFANDDRFTAEWWSENADFAPPRYQWRSYVCENAEVARVLLSLEFQSHELPHTAAVLIWFLEVRADLQRSRHHYGTAVVTDLAAEFSNIELYVGPNLDAIEFWSRFGWPMCSCEDCRGNHMMIRRAGIPPTPIDHP